MRLAEWLMELPVVINWPNTAIAIGVMALCLLLRNILTKYVFSFLVRKFHRSDDKLLWTQAFERPLSAFFVIIGIYIGLSFVLPLEWRNTLLLDRLFRNSCIILFGWGIFNLSATSSAVLEAVCHRFGLDHSNMLIPFLSKVIRFVIIVLVITAVGSDWGFNINGVVAGMGLGSLALAFAAKESLSNIFGGIVLILERPFSKGDWILTPSVEGFIEDITFRSTQIRTFADSLVTVPNSILANQPITNWSQMGKRRVTFTLKVALNSDRELLERAIQRLQQLLHMHEQVDQKLIMVHFSEFQESSLGIFFYFFTKTTVWTEYMAIKQELNLEIMRILEEEGIHLAYPAQRVLLETSEHESELAREKVYL